MQFSQITNSGAIISNQKTNAGNGITIQGSGSFASAQLSGNLLSTGSGTVFNNATSNYVNAQNNLAAKTLAVLGNSFAGNAEAFVSGVFGSVVVSGNAISNSGTINGQLSAQAFSAANLVTSGRLTSLDGVTFNQNLTVSGSAGQNVLKDTTVSGTFSVGSGLISGSVTVLGDGLKASFLVSSGLMSLLSGAQVDDSLTIYGNATFPEKSLFKGDMIFVLPSVSHQRLTVCGNFLAINSATQASFQKQVVMDQGLVIHQRAFFSQPNVFMDYFSEQDISVCGMHNILGCNDNSLLRAIVGNPAGGGRQGQLVWGQSGID